VIDTNLNHFELFSLPVSFQVEDAVLDQEYKKLQAEVHPDRFVDADDRTRLQALQQTSMVNDAYETLKSPLKRSAYLLKLHDIDAEEHNQAHLQEEFLLQQLEMREALETLIESDDVEGLEAMRNSVNKEKTGTLELFESHFLRKDFTAAKSNYNQLQFLFKLLDEIDKAEEKLLDY
jgi:molecular chaperone HscB